MKSKILTLIPSLYGGGAEKVVADTSFRLSESYNHTIITYNRKRTKYPFSAKSVDFNVSTGGNKLLKIIRYFKIFKKIKKYKKYELPEISISHLLVANILNVLTRQNNKVICVIHGEWSFKTGNFFLDKLIKFHYRRADQIISVSNYIKKLFESNYKISVPHNVIHIGVQKDMVFEKSKENINFDLPKKYLVYVAGFRKVKNHLLLIDELKEFLETTDFYLVLVGDGELRNEIKAKIKKYNLIKKIILLGNLENPYPVIKKAYLSLLMSYSESFSLVVVESMLLGVPVIATDCGGPREIIAPGYIGKELETPLKTDFGFLIGKINKFVNRGQLVGVVNLIINDECLYNKLSVKSIERAKKFDTSFFEEGLINVIESLRK